MTTYNSKSHWHWKASFQQTRDIQTRVAVSSISQSSLSAFMDQLCAHAFGYRLEPVKSCRQLNQKATISPKTTDYARITPFLYCISFLFFLEVSHIVINSKSWYGDKLAENHTFVSTKGCCFFCLFFSSYSTSPVSKSWATPAAGCWAHWSNRRAQKCLFFCS